MDGEEPDVVTNLGVSFQECTYVSLPLRLVGVSIRAVETNPSPNPTSGETSKVSTCKTTVHQVDGRVVTATQVTDYIALISKCWYFGGPSRHGYERFLQ